MDKEMWSLISKTSVFYNIWKNPLQREEKESIFNRPQRSVRHGNKKKTKKHVDRGSGKMIYSSSTVRKGSEEVL
ncbi:hypothetical protein CGK76_03715, partial [Erysipelotrichaceae bacterium 7770_A6]|nr:hypothetical protein [Erysipelotrichaceae bacterium 7770_A6]